MYLRAFLVLSGLPILSIESRLLPTRVGVTESLLNCKRPPGPGLCLLGLSFMARKAVSLTFAGRAAFPQIEELIKIRYLRRTERSSEMSLSIFRILLSGFAP